MRITKGGGLKVDEAFLAQYKESKATGGEFPGDEATSGGKQGPSTWVGTAAAYIYKEQDYVDAGGYLHLYNPSTGQHIQVDTRKTNSRHNYNKDWSKWKEPKAKTIQK